VDYQRVDFFVSYTGVDERWAVWIADVLERAGFSVVVQAWDFVPGSNFVIEMQNAARFSQRLIAVVSPAYLAAAYPQPEWAAAFAADPQGAKRKLIPVMVQRCEPEGLLGQIVQIRIYNLDREAAARRLLDGVKGGRAKPAEPVAFPGAAGFRPDSAASASTPSDARLTWHPLPAPPAVLWRNDLDGRLPNQAGNEAVELHLVPVGDQARLQVRELTGLKAALPDHGRRHGIFSPTEALDARADSTKTVVLSRERGRVAGLGVTRTGQRSSWLGLPRDMLGAVLDESHLTEQLVGMLAVLTSLPLPAAERVAPVIGIEPAAMIAIGSVAQIPRSSAQIGHGMPRSVRPAAGDAVAMAAIPVHGKDVASELAARLVTEHRSAAKLW
jgi:hypothetical protein